MDSNVAMQGQKGAVFSVNQTPSSPRPDTSLISVEAALALWRASMDEPLSKVVFVDVRSTTEFEESHILGARSDGQQAFLTLYTDFGKGVPESSWADHLRQYFEKLGIENDSTIVFYGNRIGADFGAPGRAGMLARLAGIPRDKIYVIEEGFSAWRRNGLPSSGGSTDYPSSRFEVALDRSDFVLRAELSEAIRTGRDVKILDVRASNEWEGVASAPYDLPSPIPAGRLEMSRHIPYQYFFDDDDTIERFKSPKEIIGMLALAGIGPDDETWLFCFKGSRASEIKLLLDRCGFHRVRVCLGSWNEVSQDQLFPGKIIGSAQGVH